MANMTKYEMETIQGLFNENKYNFCFRAENSGKTVMSYRLLCHCMNDGYLDFQINKQLF